MRHKRGQVTVFVIIGIVTLLAFLLIFLARDLFIEQIAKVTNVQKRLQSTLGSITESIDKCITQETNKALQELGEGGGYFQPLSSASYYGKKFTYLCTLVDGQQHCAQQLLTKQDIQNRLNIRLQQKISACINLNPYQNKDYTLSTGSLSASTLLFPKNIYLNITYPITLTKDTYTVKREHYNKILPIPLGTILDATGTILSEHAATGDFDLVQYAITTRNTYDINRYISYPHTLYTIKYYGSNYLFQFGIEGRA